MNSQINIARVTTAGLTALHYISRKTFTEAFAHLNSPDDMQAYLADHLTVESLSEELANANSEFYFAIENNEPIAYFKINTGNAQTDLKEANGLEIERIYVLQNYQGKKLGHDIITACIKIAMQKNKAYVWLGVWEHNVNAIRFYQNNGFVVFDKHSFRLGNDMQTDIMMRYELAT
jgi:ribosomal protein S18 acetylase RimI-like enzyme